MTLSEARQITGGGLSAPSKMPGHAYSLPAGAACPTGSKLMKVPGSRCHQCYALRGNYRFENVKRRLQARLESLKHPRWVEAMTLLILDASRAHRGCDKRRCDGGGSRYFRWHDSGDLQGVWHLLRIFSVCAETPRVKHWLPTGEVRIVEEAQRFPFPANLTVRMSAPYVDSGMGVVGQKLVSTVHTSKSKARFLETWGQGAYVCPAHDQGNRCGDCRACWDRRVRHVSYRKH